MRKKKWQSFTKEELQEFVYSSSSYGELAEKCGYQNASQNWGAVTYTVKDMIEALKLDDTNLKRDHHPNFQNFDYSRFKYGNNLTAANMLDALAHLRGRQCEVCGLNEWNGTNIPLEVHHLDGDRLNNEISNLQLICPNCHALTETYRGKNNTKAKSPVSDDEFVEALKQSKNIRQALLKLGLTPKGANYFRAKDLIVKYNISNIKF